MTTTATQAEARIARQAYADRFAAIFAGRGIDVDSATFTVCGTVVHMATPYMWDAGHAHDLLKQAGWIVSTITAGDDVFRLAARPGDDR